MSKDPKAREAQFQALVQQFPDNPMGHFSLGKVYLEQGRYAESAACLERAAQLDVGYAAALVSLGDAYAGAGQAAKAREAFARALKTPTGQRDMSLQAYVQQRLGELPA